ncbi:hypothetical protein ABZX85_23335 [Streptomyces sp. NPDC004539]|uniref:hypothetical protein n=1 Tax=Streptomyces sp. NPDC004539 TaxID=3154280 RepID=UPI00339E6D15
MASYAITFDSSHEQRIAAVDCFYDADGEQYIFSDGRGQHVALVPRLNVLSVVRVEVEATP